MCIRFLGFVCLFFLYLSASWAQQPLNFNFHSTEIAGETHFVPPPEDEWQRNMPQNYIPKETGLHQVRAFYLVPANRTANPNVIDNMRYVIRLNQAWFKEQMERNGFGPKTYIYETEMDGITPKIHIVTSPEPDTYFQNASNWFKRVYTAAQNAGLPVWSPRQVWYAIYEGHAMLPDGTIVGSFNGGSSNGSGSDPGMGMTSAMSAGLSSSARMIDDQRYNNLVIPDIGPYPLKENISFSWFEGTTVSQISSVYHGVILHEFSHGFGLNHNFRNDMNFNGNMMGNGLRGSRGSYEYTRYPRDEMRLSYSSAIALNVSRYFNNGMIYTDETKPTVSILTSGTAVPVNGLLQIRFNASDSGGLAAAVVRDLAASYGDVVGSMALSGTSGEFVLETPNFTAGTAASFEVSVYDLQGNRMAAQSSITPAVGYNQAPRPFVQVQPSWVEIGELVTLKATDSFDPEGNAFTVEWDINGDGIFDTTPSTAKVFQSSFSNKGSRQIRVRLTDSFGAHGISEPIGLRIGAIPTSAKNWQKYQ